MSGWGLDLRYAWRALRRAPGFSAIAIGCFAAGIGVNAAAFSFLDALLVRDLPGVERQHEINTILVSRESRWGRTSPGHLARPDWDAFDEGLPALSHSSVAGTASVALRRTAGPQAIRAEFVSGGFFELLGTRPAAGRLLSREDDRAGAPPAVVISDQLWEREFQRRPDVLGQPLQVGTAAFTIVGVTPRGFVGLYPGELVADPEFGPPLLFLPLAAAPLVRPASRYASPTAALEDRWLRFAGRRRPGATADEVEAQANVVTTRLAAAYPIERVGMAAEARAPSTASRAETIAAFGFVMVVPFILLLVACANLANQLLARGVQRGGEIAVRLSLGASRARVIRQLLVEALMLALAGSLAAVLLARVLVDLVGTWVLVIPFRIPVDLRVVGFTLALAIPATIAFGMLPALRVSRVDLAQAVKEGGKAGGYRRSRLRSGLVVAQVAASVALLALSGVFARASLRSRVGHAEEHTNRLLTLTVQLDLLGYSAPAGQAFQVSAMERLRDLPGVEAVALAQFGPVATIPWQRVAITGDAPDRVRWYNVAPVAGDWFAARGLRPLTGRIFNPAEARGAIPVAVVDDVAAAYFWPNASAVGQIVRLGDGSDASVVMVIGVVPALPEPRGEEPEGVIYVPPTGEYHPRAHFYVRTAGNAAAYRTAVSGVMRDLDPRLPPASVATLGESLDETGASVAQLATGVGALGGVTIVLAALGLWAVLSFVVEQRRYEIGVRVALGARPAAVTRMVLRQSLGLATLGIAAGAVVAAAGAITLRGMLFGLPPLDPIAFAGSTAIILVVAMLSSVGPARRAARVDPMVPLRAE